MLFSSMEFLWYFLPLVFLGSRLLRGNARNILLLVFSLIFYAWGEPIYILLMLFSITFNWAAGFFIDKNQGNARRWALIGTLAVNLGLLGYFKYFDFFLGLINSVAGREVVPLVGIALPIGISFYTFQILSYVIDLYWGNNKLQRNWASLALYISFFPQLIAGPIVNYGDVADQLGYREIFPEKTAYGIKRFIYGLAKKVLIANTMARTVDNILMIGVDAVPSSYLWLAFICYALQIYYDFSGYSDMAVGLGKIFGFTFMENFDYPYISKTVTEFWRRWHISLSSWFRDYLYIPLGGNRKGLLRTCFNLFVVFVLTGLWHGAGLNFLAWGLWHGFFLINERLWLGKLLERAPLRYVRRIYTLTVVFFGWIFFRAESITHAFRLLLRMFSFSAGDPVVYFQSVGGVQVLVMMAVGILLAGPLQSALPKLRAALYNEQETGYLQMGLLAFLLMFCIVQLVSGSYNPFIYFRF